MIQVVVGIVKNQQNDILIAQRLAHTFCPGLWEFPGGKVESNETEFTALKREFKEEIGIDVLTAAYWFHSQHHYPDRIIQLNVWQIVQFQGIPQGVEGQVIRWVPVSQLIDYQFPAGNQLIIEKLLIK